MLSLTGIELLSYTRNNQFFGDTLRYATRDSLSLQGKLIDLANTSGAAGILSQLSGQNQAAIDFDFLSLNGAYIGLARIESINYAVGNDIKTKNYTINATIYQSGSAGNLNYNGSLYSGLNLANPLAPVYLIDQFTESFSPCISENGDNIEQQN